MGGMTVGALAANSSHRQTQNAINKAILERVARRSAFSLR